jgi:hypothetical protein
VQLASLLRAYREHSPDHPVLSEVQEWAEAADIHVEKALFLLADGLEPTAQFFGGAGSLRAEVGGWS